MAALATMLFASCQQQELPEPVPQENTVTYTVEVPGVQTKAIGDGTNINQLVYEVWKTEDDNERNLKDATKATRLYQKTVPMAPIDGKIKTVISLNLVQDQSYTVLFWAQCVPDGKQSEQGASEYYNTDNLTAVTYKNLDANGVPANYLSNNESMAAFYKTVFLTKAETDTPNSRSVELRRPFAQLNIATKNTSDEYKIKMNKSNVTISNVPTVFDVAWNQVATPDKDAVSGVTVPASFAFGYADVPSDPSKITVNKQEYEYVAMNYIFASDNVTVEYNVDVTLTSRNLDGTDGATTNAVIYNKVVEVPLKENYRTNIVGNLLTHTTDYEVIVDAGWDDIYDEDLNGDGIVVEVWDQKYIQEPPKNANGEYEISLASELAWLSAAVNGKLPATKADTQDPRTFTGETFVLKEDVDLTGALWNPIGATGTFKGTFDGNGKTIKGLKVATEGTVPAGLFGNVQTATIKNVTVDGAEVSGHYSAAVIVAHGVCAKIENCHVKGNSNTVTSTVINNDDGNNVGGIVGYLAADEGSVNAWVKNSSVENTTITAFRKVGGIAGYANGSALVTENSVTGTTVITADQTVSYKTEEDGNAGSVVGGAHAKASITANTVGEDVTVVRKVDSTKELEYAAADAQDGDTIYVAAGEGAIDMPKFENKSLSFEGIGDVILNQPSSTHATKDYAGSEIYFKNVTIDGTAYGVNPTYHGFVGALKETYDFCTFTDYFQFAADEVIVNDATFVCQPGQYFWTGLADDVTFNRCKFNGVDRALHLCSVIAGEEHSVTLNNCEFTATELDKAAIEIDGSKGPYVLNINETTATGFAEGENTGEIMFNIKNTPEKVTVYLDGSKWMGEGNFVDEEGNKTVTKQGALEDAVATENAVVKVLAGEYTFPSGVAEGVTIECAEGAVFTGNTKLNIKGATVIGATFSNPSGTVVDQTINGTFKNCTFTGKNAVRWSYSGDTCVFEDCVFDGETYGFHSDGGSKPITFIRCSFSGFNAFAGTIPMVTFEDCVFKSNGKSGYNGANLWGSATFKNTKFMFDGSASYEWIDCIGTDKSYEFTGCTIGTDGSLFQPELIFSRNNGTNVTIDGKGYTWIGYFADAEGNTYVTNVADLQTVVDNAPVGNTTIHILNNLAGDATVAQKPDVKLVIDGNNKNYDGMITVDGKSATYTTAGLTIKDLNFAATSISADACINLGKKGDNNTRYTCNVTVDNCTFDVPGAVGVKSYTGGDKNLTIKGCTATTNAHSLVQAKGIDGILIEKCNVYSKNGLNFNNSTNVIVNECNADVRGYAARFGEGSAATGAAETYSIKNSTLKSACEEANDAVIVLRGTADNSTLTIENTTLEGTRQIINNATGSRVIFDGKDYVCTADGLTAALANKEVKNIVLMPGTYEGTFQINNGTIESEDATNKAVIKGRVECINPNVTFKNVKFDYNDASKKEFSSAVVGNPKGHPAIVGVYGGAQHSATFDSCDFAFKSGYNSEKAPGAVSHYGAVNLVMNECVLDGEGNPIYAKTNIEMTGCTVKMYGGNAVLSLNYSNEGRKVIFKNNTVENKSTNGAKTYGMQMLSTNGKAYKDMYFDVQGNTVDVMFAIGSGYTFEGVSYATGSEQIK